MSIAIDIHSLAQGYHRRGWQVIPNHAPTDDGGCTCGRSCASQGKHPALADWQNARLSEADLGQYFNHGRPVNIGALLGAASGGLVDVDLDVAEALGAASLLLPSTGAIFGRASKPGSHWLYIIQGTSPRRSAYSATDGTMLVELRGDGCQTILPGSRHRSGEMVTWDQDGPPATITSRVLQRAVARLAAATALARVWPSQGSRQEAALALAGGLARAGWPVEDIMRFVEAVAVAAGDEEVRKRVEAVGYTARRLNVDAPTTGWRRLVDLVGGDTVEVVQRWLGVPASAGQPGVTKEPRQPPWPVLREDAFHGLAGEIVRAIAPETEADPAALLVGLLVSVGNVVGRGPHARVGNTRHGTNEYAVIVGDTSKARKDTARNEVRPLFMTIDQQWATERQGSGLSSGEGFIHQVRDPVTKHEKNKQTGQYEEVVVDPGVTDKRLLVDESEFVTALKVTQREGNTLSDNVRKAWDGRVLQSMVRNSPLRATDPHIAIIGNITREELSRHLTQTETANGFGNRFLFICAKRARLLPDGGDHERVRARLAPLLRRLKDAVTWASVERAFTRDAGATALWTQAYHKLANAMPGLAGALTARGEAHILRLSVIYAALDQSEQVRVPHLRAAVGVWRYCEESVRYLFGDAVGDATADRILDALIAEPGGLTKTEILRLFGSNMSAARVDAALAMLATGRRVSRKRELGEQGRSVERWVARPATEWQDDWDAVLDGTYCTYSTCSEADSGNKDSSNTSNTSLEAKIVVANGWEEGEL